MKKVLFVATRVKLHIMLFHIPYLKWFSENGYEVHVAAKNDYSNKKTCCIPYCDVFYDINFERSPFRIENFKNYQKLKRIINENNYSIIHCHTPMGGVIGRLAALNSRKRGTKVIYTAHGFHFYKGGPILSWLLYYPIEKLLSNYTDILITINSEDFSIAKKFKNSHVEFVPGVGINIEKYANTKVDYNKMRNTLGINEDELLIISVGELNANKNHQLVINALSRINNKNIKYILCGQGELENELRDLSSRLGVESQVQFLGFRDDIAELMKISNIFAFPSLREGLSLSLMEAMSSGLPVVCSNIRGNMDLIENGKGGFLSKSNDVEDFKAQILKLLLQEDISEYGEFNKNRIKLYSLENVLKIMIEIYKSV